MSVTFRKQVDWFPQYASSRKRKPLKPSTVLTWKVCAEKWVKPILGDLHCEQVNNKALKLLIEKMVEGGLAPQTIVNYTALVKLALVAATDENGERLYPRTWNSTFLDMPIVKDQRQPSFLPEKVSSIVSKACGQTRVILTLLVGSGLRMGELVGLEVKHVSLDCRILSIEQSIWNQDVQSPKSRNAYRKVDLCMDVAVMLGQHLGSRSGGYVGYSDEADQHSD